jgi:predicted RNase H-like HicB family nuclease
VPHYVALILEGPDSVFGVSFPDLPGIVTAGDTLEEAIEEAAEALAFAAEDWAETTGTPFPEPRSLDELRADPGFVAEAAGATVVSIPFGEPTEAA